MERPLGDHGDIIPRPPRTRNPGPLQQPQRCEAVVQSPGGGAGWSPARIMERPPRTDAPAPAERPPRSSPPPPVQRPPRSNPPPPVQRPPRTAPPAPPVQTVLRRDFPASLQRPPRTDNPAPVSRPPGYAPIPRLLSPPPPTPHNSPDSPLTAARLSGEMEEAPPTAARLSGEMEEAPPTAARVSGERSGGQSSERRPDGCSRVLEERAAAEAETSGNNRQPPPEEEGAGGSTPAVASEEELVIPMDEDQRRRKRRKVLGKRRNRPGEDASPPASHLDQDLDRALEDRAKHHNLTAVNVRNILHEVITNEHVVAMMKAAITDTEGLPMFEPKMTRSKLKEVVEKGVVIPTWNLSPIKKANKVQGRHFVDIPLEEEDSSDEEYRPEEEEEETAEESLLESDVESAASSPRGHKRPRWQRLSESQEEESVDGQQVIGLSGADPAPMGPPPPPKVRLIQDTHFMETLHAVEEELERHPVSLTPFQTSLDAGLIACRTRSKQPLKDVPIGQLEAELRAPDITPDMYDPNTADDDNWKLWLRGLMQDDVGNEDEADDEDDPEYNILEDWDEPDTEDLRNDRAVRITKKEVNELMEELFETFQDEMGISQLEEEGPDDEDSSTDPLPDFNTPQAIRFEEPLANLLTEQHRTVRAQLEFLRMRKSMTRAEEERSPPRAETPRPAPPPKLPPVMSLDGGQRKRLQQQMQQHVQLLTQLHLLTFRNPHLSQQASTARMYLVELSGFAERSSLCRGPRGPAFQSMFQPCNLREALQLIPLVHSRVPEDVETPKPAKKNVSEVTNLPKHMAWVIATRPLFMYPELLPICAMRARGPRDRVYFTKAEDNLLALGLKHFEGAELAKQLISRFLLPTKTSRQLAVRIKNLTMKKAPENIIKFYKRTKVLPALSGCCEDVAPQDWRAPVEREKQRLPFWIKASLGSIEAEMRKVERDPQSVDGTYPLLLPPGVTLSLKPFPRRLYRRAWKQKCLKPLLIRPAPKPAPHPLPVRVIQPAVPVHGVSLQKDQVPGDIAAATQKARQPLIGGVTRKKLLSRATPAVHSGPLLFAVPNGGVKLLSLAPSYSVLQPISAGSGVHVATILLNSTQIPLNPTFSPAPVTLPGPARQEAELRNTGKKEDDEWDCVSITIKVEAETKDRPEDGGGAQPQEESVSSADAPGLKAESNNAEAGRRTPQKAELRDGTTEDTPGEPVDMQDPEEVPVQDSTELNQSPNPETTGATDSPRNTSSSIEGDAETSSPAEGPGGASSPLDGQDVGEKGPEEEEDEEEEEELDLTQDEDEMSSASEESVLSVPELQETMEKLTWLASERRMSQEGDSEDNSPEENTEAEEEEEEDKAPGMAAEAGAPPLAPCHLRVPSPAPVEERAVPAEERRRGGSKGRSSHRARSRRGRTRTSKDTGKLRLLYDEKILSKDPLREQKDMAYAQSYLSRVREALRAAPGTYEEFLSLIYEFEARGSRRTAVDLYESLRRLLRDWPQLLRDFAAFLLPEQALECGLFQEQQAFEKSRRFLRQLEICFVENPAQHHKIIRLLQSCAQRPLEESGKLKSQMWQLLRGHVHLQEEFSLFFDQLRPPASHMGDFEVMTWTEDKEYKFDGFEEVTLPDVEEEEEKRNKRRKEAAGGQDKDADWLDCSCSCHEVGAEPRLKRCKRRTCTHCGCKKSTDVPGPQGAALKEAGCKSSAGEERPGPGARVSGSSRAVSAPERCRSLARDGASKPRHPCKDRATVRGGRRHHAARGQHVGVAERGPEDSAPPLSGPPPSHTRPKEEAAREREDQAGVMCAKNITVSSSGEKVVLWTREADRVILTMCQERGAQELTFQAVSAQLGNKSASQVAQRFRELIALFQTGCGSSEEEEDGAGGGGTSEAEED